MRHGFSILIIKAKTWYIARCPERNVTSQGQDIESARANLKEALELYLETWGDPAPKLSF
jgi:predicted RNase H-like HicB family nuclease